MAKKTKANISFPKFKYEPVVRWTTFKPSVLGGETELTLPAKSSIPGKCFKMLVKADDDSVLADWLQEQGVPEEWATVLTDLPQRDAEKFMREWFEDEEGHFLPKSQD